MTAHLVIGQIRRTNPPKPWRQSHEIRRSTLPLPKLPLRPLAPLVRRPAGFVRHAEPIHRRRKPGRPHHPAVHGFRPAMGPRRPHRRQPVCAPFAAPSRFAHLRWPHRPRQRRLVGSPRATKHGGGRGLGQSRRVHEQGPGSGGSLSQLALPGLDQAGPAASPFVRAG